MATWGDYIGLIVFLAVSGGMAYAAYLVPKLLNPETKHGSDDQPKEKRGPRISRTNSGIRIENLGQMDADKASYNMVKGGRDMARKMKATQAVSFGNKRSASGSTAEGADRLEVPSASGAGGGGSPSSSRQSSPRL